MLLRRPTGDDLALPDLPDFFNSRRELDPADFEEARVHFHIPLDAEPAPPLRSTRDQPCARCWTWRNDHPDACRHFEIETYTWGVLPAGLRRPVEEQIAGEYRWVIGKA